MPCPKSGGALLAASPINRMAVKFQYEWHDADNQWYRSYGNELWEFAPSGLMQRREASINDLAITAAEKVL